MMDGELRKYAQAVWDRFSDRGYDDPDDSSILRALGKALEVDIPNDHVPEFARREGHEAGTCWDWKSEDEDGSLYLSEHLALLTYIRDLEKRLDKMAARIEALERDTMSHLFEHGANGELGKRKEGV